MQLLDLPQVARVAGGYRGIKSFGRAAGPDGKPFVAVLLNCVDNISDAELAALPITYVDGRNDDFGSTPTETRHL
jgi:hypothetical protein